MERDIQELIPQRNPIIQVDELIRVEGDTAETCLLIKADNYFIDEDQLFAEPGLIEHIAQSASAFAGYQALQQGATTPPVGYIGEVKHFHCYRRPAIGERLHTTITMGAEVAGVTMLTGETRVGEEVVADTKMKIFVEQ